MVVLYLLVAQMSKELLVTPVIHGKNHNVFLSGKIDKLSPERQTCSVTRFGQILPSNFEHLI